MKRKGQAAMEFLMTYGWAILVVLAAIAALAYFGVLSPGSMLPERTVFAAPVPNVDNAIVQTDGTVEIAFTNNVGQTIRLPGIAGGTEDCDGGSYDSAELADGTNIAADTDIRNGEVFRVTWTGCDAGSEGDRFSSTMSFTYTNTYTGQEISHSGDVNGRYR